MNTRSWQNLWAALLIISLLGISAAAPAFSQAAQNERYSYHSAAFTAFVAESYQATKSGDPHQFYAWMQRVFPRVWRPAQTARPLADLLERERRSLGKIHDSAARARRETELAAGLQAAIKKVLPVFSLRDGAEFARAAQAGHRQCLLQSVLLASLLQAMDVRAGVVMVNRNAEGVVSNNGHCVTLVTLTDGRDVLADCSEKSFARHQGLMTRTSDGRGYAYVSPIYSAGGAYISGFQQVVTKAAVKIQPLDTAFLRSQFAYYRAEQTVGGLTVGSLTPPGLALEASRLQTAIRDCPVNPLPVYMLGRVWLRQGNSTAARTQIAQAARLYAGDGWVPPGCKDALAATARL